MKGVSLIAKEAVELAGVVIGCCTRAGDIWGDNYLNIQSNESG